MRKLALSLVVLALLASQSGCIVAEPRPVVYEYPGYTVYYGPDVVYYRGGYYHHGYWR